MSKTDLIKANHIYHMLIVGRGQYLSKLIRNIDCFPNSISLFYNNYGFTLFCHIIKNNGPSG